MRSYRRRPPKIQYRTSNIQLPTQSMHTNSPSIAPPACPTTRRFPHRRRPRTSNTPEFHNHFVGPPSRAQNERQAPQQLTTRTPNLPGAKPNKHRAPHNYGPSHQFERGQNPVAAHVGESLRDSHLPGVRFACPPRLGGPTASSPPARSWV